MTRFSLAERTLHWLTAASFANLLLSSLVIHTTVGLVWHVASACAMVLSIGVMVVRRRTRRLLSATARDLGRLTADDRRWLRTAPSHMSGRGQAPPAGRFNAGQKLNARALALLLPLTLASGVGALMHIPPGALHGPLVFLTTVIVGGHVLMATVHPHTRHALRGMLRGSVRRDWAEEHHPLWVAETES